MTILVRDPSNDKGPKTPIAEMRPRGCSKNGGRDFKEDVVSQQSKKTGRVWQGLIVMQKTIKTG